MITGHVASKKLRLVIGSILAGLILVVLAPVSWIGGFDNLEYRGLDWLQSTFPGQSSHGNDIAILYIDQKSIDFFQQSRGIGWPWPRDSYALAVQYLKEAGARAVVFDAIYSEPSVFAGDYNDDQAFAEAMSASGRVFQTLTFHAKVKGGAPNDPEALALLAARGTKYVGEEGARPPEFQDVTMPIRPLAEAALGLGAIDIEPESDGVMRRMRLLSSFNGQVYPTLGLAVYMKINSLDEVVQKKSGLQVGGILVPTDDQGRTLIKYYGGEDYFQGYTMAAIIQSALDVMEQKTPLVAPELFRDKVVFVGAKAAGLFDLRSTPLEKSLPGVDIHATFLNNLLADDFLKRASRPVRSVTMIALLLGTVAAAILGRSAFVGAGFTLGLSALYLALAVFLFNHRIWLDLISPLGGQALVFVGATLVNYYGEGRQKREVRGAFSRYLSPQVVDQVLEQPELLSLGGSRRIMTCFFSDVAGFTSISEALSPEELVHLLNRYLSLMTKVIMESGGTVDKFEGDAIMAFWGAPLPQDDHAWRACRAALDQQEIMARFRAEVLAEGLPELRVRMGLNTGPMIVGNMGSEDRFDYTVMGDAVNLASRLEGANKQYGTYLMISESTYAEVRTLVEVRELDLLRVKGKQEPIRVYELMGAAGALPPEKDRVRSVYQEGLALYRDMDFTGAEQAFVRALEMDPGDGPSLTYVERCRAYREQPPPSDWDRVFTMTTK
jgi:adenylate cyclase